MANILLLTSAAPEKSGFNTSEKRPPLGVGFLISVLKIRGHKVYFSDEYLQPTDILESSFLEKTSIDFVGIYSNTVCLQSTLDMLKKLEVKKAAGWKGKIIVGGPHTSVGEGDFPEYVDYIVKGEGETAIIEIVESKKSDRIIIGKRIENLDLLPRPAWEEFVFRPYNWRDKFLDKYPIYTLNTSRGCPFKCTFCSVHSIWGRRYRYMSAERIVDDIEFMITNYGAKGIYFREDHFALNKKRTVDFCESLLKKNIQIDWVCETRVDSLWDLEYQKLLSRAGCKCFYIGVESGSPRMLEFFKKEETVDQFIEAFDNAKIAGIKTYASFVVGAPTETDLDRNLTDQLIERIKPDFVGKNVFVGIPGSELYDYVRRNKLIEFEDNNHILYPLGYLKNVEKYYGENEYYNVSGEVSFLKSLRNRTKEAIKLGKKAIKALLGYKSF